MNRWVDRYRWITGIYIYIYIYTKKNIYIYRQTGRLFLSMLISITITMLISITTCRTISYIICVFESSTRFEQPSAHPQEDNCIKTTSGKITLC
jgi:hypothetical protein